MADLPVADDLIAPTVTEDQFKAALKLLVDNVVSKNSVDLNPLFKPKAMVAGNDLNNFTVPGIYVLWATLTSAQLLNAPYYSGGNAVRGVLVVDNPQVDGSGKTGCSQRFYPAADGLQIAYRKCTQAGTWPSGWDSLLRGSDIKALTRLTTGTDILGLSLGEYQIYSATDGDTMLNMPTATRKAGRISVSLTAGTNLRSITFTPFGDDPGFYINKELTLGSWQGWKTFKDYASYLLEFTSRAYVADAISAMLAAMAQNEYFGKVFTTDELTGTKVYPSAMYAGFNSVTVKPAIFNKVSARIWNTSGGEIQYRVYMGSKTLSTAYGLQVPAASIGNPDFSGICKSFPVADSGTAQSIELDQVISIPAATPFVIVFKRTVNAVFSIAAHAAVTGNLESRSFSFATANVDWSGLSSITNASFPTYTQAGFQLKLDVMPASTAYVPALVMPPKIYVLANLQAHIYPEHLLPEAHELYLHDVTCTLGKQMKRGWVYDVPTSQAASNNSLTWAIADRQTGAIITSASTTVVVAPQTTSGTKNVLVIGDSYINAGVITQRLLDIAATDPLKVNLIGTRGTGSNKHEGRGGWKVADYAGAGLSNYRFTVSGVTTVPAINSTTYTFNGTTYLVQEVAISGGSGTITASVYGGPVPTTVGGAGTLTKANAGIGDSSIAFSNWVELTGNPFWISGALNFSQYLTSNSLTTPDVVIIELGVNDCFSLTSDAAVETLTTTAFSQLDSLIASIKSANSSVKIGLAIPSVYANQDGFGTSYACGQTAWRAKRNIVTWNRKLIAYYSGKEAQNIYLVASGLNVDTENNFPVTNPAVAINSQNSNTVVMQNNGVHPADSGYKQIGDALFAFLKAI